MLKANPDPGRTGRGSATWGDMNANPGVPYFFKRQKKTYNIRTSVSDPDPGSGAF
jgi:hypothetical protein